MMHRLASGGCFMPEIDFYKTLGVSRNASAEEIRKAYKKLAQNTIPTSARGTRMLPTNSRKCSKPTPSWAIPKSACSTIVTAVP